MDAEREAAALLAPPSTKEPGMSIGLLTRRRLVALAAAAALIMAVLSCSTNGDGNRDENNPSASEDTAAGTDPAQPHPAGTEVQLDDWKLTLSGLQLDITEDLVAADPYATEPQLGNEFAMYTIDATYTGDGVGSLLADFGFGLWTDSKFYIQCPATPPNSVYLTPEVSSGGTVSGNFCVEIPTGASDLVAFVEIYSSEETVFFALSEAGAGEGQSDGTSSDAALPAGSAVTVGSWSVTVSDLQLNAVGDAPEDIPEGSQLVLYEVEGTYSGTGVASLAFDVDTGIWVDGSFHAEGCTTFVPNYLADAPDVESGGTASGTACAVIPDAVTDPATVLFYVTMPETELATRYYIKTQ